jgi:peptidoglycan/LPS O-acetylase OafA/YrhL
MQEETGKHLTCLDGWRGLAITAVLLGHFALESQVPGLGVFGVDLFFVLSGRLMAEILFVRRSPLPTFFLRRFSRVYPALFVFVLATTLAAAGTSYSHGMKAVLVALTFTINYAMIYTHPIGLLDHLWSLCVEEHAYILLALVAVATTRTTRFAVIAMLTVTSLAITNAAIQTWVMHKGYFQIYWRSDVQVAPIFMGGALYLAKDKIRLMRSF